MKRFLFSLSQAVFVVCFGMLVICTSALNSQSMQASFTFTINQGGIVTFSSTSVNTPSNIIHHWYFGDGTSALNVTSVAHTYSAVGNYTAILSLENSAGFIYDSTSKAIIITDITGMEEQEYDKEIFTVFPNPAVNDITIQNRKGTLIKEYFITDPLGKKIVHQFPDSETTVIGLSSYPGGSYYLHLKSSEGTQIKKIILSEKNY